VLKGTEDVFADAMPTPNSPKTPTATPTAPPVLAEMMIFFTSPDVIDLRLCVPIAERGPRHKPHCTPLFLLMKSVKLTLEPVV
jgi:hypothetical protein